MWRGNRHHQNLYTIDSAAAKKARVIRILPNRSSRLQHRLLLKNRDYSAPG